MRSCVKDSTPLASGTARACSCVARAGGTTSRCCRAPIAWVVMPWTSTYWKTRFVRLVVMASWIAGSWARGATVSTYRSVSVTWLRAQTEVTESGASRQAIRMSSTAPTVRPQRLADRAGRRAGGDPEPASSRSWATSARSRSSSARSSVSRTCVSSVGLAPSAGALPARTLVRVQDLRLVGRSCRLLRGVVPRCPVRDRPDRIRLTEPALWRRVRGVVRRHEGMFRASGPVAVLPGG